MRAEAPVPPVAPRTVRGRLARVANRTIGPRARLSQPPAMVLGTARSGTSWIGATLGAAPTAAYLREPVTHTVFQERTDLIADLAEPDPTAEVVELSDRAFSGDPRQSPAVTIWPTQFQSRRAKQLVVKEVVPFCVDWLIDRYAARAVLIRRHPAAIVASWHRRGWYRVPYDASLEDSLSHPRLVQDPVARLAAVFSLHERALTEAADAHGHRARIIDYEDLARQPVSGFRSLAGHLGIMWPPSMDRHVRAGTDGTLQRRDGRGRLVRVASDRVSAWRRDLSPDVIDSVREGYRLAGGGAYDNDW